MIIECLPPKSIRPARFRSSVRHVSKRDRSLGAYAWKASTLGRCGPMAEWLLCASQFWESMVRTSTHLGN